MDFRFTTEEEAFRAEVRAFIQQELPDDAREAETILPSTPARKAFVRRLAEKGWLAISWPAEWGGQGKSGILQFLLNDELLYAGAPSVSAGIGFIGHILMRYGSDFLKQAFLPRIARGEIEFALGYSEPEAGSDLANLQLRAVRDGDVYVLNGQKRFTSAAHFADYVWLAARTDPTVPKHRGISLFIVPIDAPGLTVRPLWALGGIRTNETYYDDVRIPKEYLVGEENRGWYYIAEALDYERFTVAGTVTRFMRQLDDLIELVKHTERDGVPLRQNPRLRHQLARHSIDMEVAKMHMLRVLDAASKGRTPNVEATMNKLWSTPLVQRIAETGVDAMGLYGQLRRGSNYAPNNGEFEQAICEHVIRTIAAGSTEVQKNILAKRALNLPG